MRWLGHNERVNKVAVVGGTHGNESTGLYLSRWLKRMKREDSFELVVLEGNPAAIKKNTRYTEEDLNRQFSFEKLDANNTTYEGVRARELDQLLGPKRSETPAFDLVIDLHNTTSPSGLALMMHPDDRFSHELGAHLTTIDTDVKIVNWANKDPRVLPSIARSGFTLEVGPVPWGVVDMGLFESTKKALLACLDYINRHNNNPSAEKCSHTVPVYQGGAVSPQAYPRLDGDINGAAHSTLKDFSPLLPGTPVLQTFDGEVIEWTPPSDTEDKDLYALFVNEAAYYENDIAFAVVEKVLNSVFTL
eukprot:TRINITY_DN33574_c0_g1_i1.p1 TRINITY_DN33574_c0_g1~~TRINITY_DN33574_c0_g1_i1.p1  ORF type:complete len:304 (+),score=53.53 TRINITY_DN33574_c0_g1_i1:36-947(+)